MQLKRRRRDATHTLIHLAACLVELDAPSVLQASLEAPNVLDVVLAGPVQCAVPVVHVVLETTSVELLLRGLVALGLEVQYALVVSLACMDRGVMFMVQVSEVEV